MERTRHRSWMLALAPIVVAAGFLVRPYTSDFTDDRVVAAAVIAQPGRWLTASAMMTAGAVLLAFALPAAVQRVGGGERRGRWVRPAMIIGTVGFALHVGLVGLGGVAAHRSGADVAAFLDASAGGTVIGISLVALLVAWVGFVRAVLAAHLPRTTMWTVVGGAALGALGHLYPASVGEYIASAGTAVALWPLAVRNGLVGLAPPDPAANAVGGAHRHP